MKCPQCNAENVDEKNFCSECGALLNQQLVPLIRSQVEEYIREHFRDQRIVELETSEAVASRVLKWARLYYALPVAVLIIILALFGISDYRDFHKTIRRATDEVKPKVNQAIAEAETATRKSQEAEAKSEAAIKAIDQATSKMNSELTSVQKLSTRLSGMESKTADQVANANKHVETRVTELDTKVESANKTIADQQAKLLNTNELVTAMFSKSEVEIFQTAQGNTATFATTPLVLPKLPAGAVPPKSPPQAVVYMLLKSAPIYQTVQINFRIYIQPKSSYIVTGNLLTFFWGESIENLKQWPLEVSYVPDPTYHGPIYKTMTLKDGRLLFDQPQ